MESTTKIVLVDNREISHKTNNNFSGQIHIHPGFKSMNLRVYVRWSKRCIVTTKQIDTRVPILAFGLLTSSNNDIHVVSPGSSPSILAFVWAAISSEGAMRQRSREAFASILDTKCSVASSGRQEEAAHNCIFPSSQIAEEPTHGSAGGVFVATASVEKSSCWARRWARLGKSWQSLIDRHPRTMFDIFSSLIRGTIILPLAFIFLSIILATEAHILYNSDSKLQSLVSRCRF